MYDGVSYKILVGELRLSSLLDRLLGRIADTIDKTKIFISNDELNITQHSRCQSEVFDTYISTD